MEQKIKEIIQRNKAQQVANCFLPKNEEEKEMVSVFNETLKRINNALEEVLKSIQNEKAMNKNIDIEYESMQETIDEGKELIAEYKEENKKLNEKIIDLSADLGMYQNENESLTKDIEKYWRLEQELGCSLEVVFKALKEGYILVYDSHYNFDDYTKTKAKITFNNNKFYIGFARNTRRLEDYKRTWWLKGEKDVKEN